jgi:RNA polymerase sigma-70 factor (sigma-E family)
MSVRNRGAAPALAPEKVAGKVVKEVTVSSTGARSAATQSSAEAEFDAFYRDTARRVVQLVYGFTGDLTVAQDSTQEAYARAWQQWSTVRTHDEPLAWVRTVARRIAISGWRKRTTQERAHLRVGTQETTGPPSEDRVAIVAALRTLTAPVREAVALHYLGDLSIDQIAHETNTPAGTIKARLHRGRAQLAQALRHEESTHG